MSSRDSTQRWTSILVGAVVIGLVGWLTIEGQSSPPTKKPAAETAPTSSTAASASVDAGAPASELPKAAETDGGLFLPTLSLGDAGLSLPTGAPRSVKIGVVLVTFAGAEGAPANARSKRDALAVAERLAGEARSDFHRAVTSGDPGSADDIGRLPRGVLDPRTEVSVFGLGSGEVSEVLETPRGFWIVKRID